MAWFGVHVVLSLRFKDGEQDVFPAWENIYLIEAEDAEGAERKAALIGQEQEGDASGTLTWNDRPSELISLGVRKVVSVSNPHSPPDEIGDGVEVTYQTLEFETRAALDTYASGGVAQMKSLD